MAFALYVKRLISLNTKEHIGMVSGRGVQITSSEKMKHPQGSHQLNDPEITPIHVSTGDALSVTLQTERC